MSWSLVVAERFDFGDNLRSLSLGADILVNAHCSTYQAAHHATYDDWFGVWGEVKRLIHEPDYPADGKRDSEEQPTSLEAFESQCGEAHLHKVGSQGAFGR